MTQCFLNIQQKFQSTLPRRERRDFCDRLRHTCRFQSTLPRRERPGCENVYLPYFNFNPRSREGSDSNFGGCSFEQEDFNPRSREGSDSVVVSVVTSPVISIHAPAKGATIPLLVITIYFIYFNPRSREGSDKSKQAIKWI